MAVATSKSASVTIIALCQVAALALWFSASAVVPALVAEYRLPGFAQAALTSGVQAGFVLGCLVSAFFGLPDRVDPRRLFAGCAVLGAVANVLLLVVDPATAAAPLLRMVTGVAMAGVYPVGMKLAATWAKGDMGLMVGILVGALTLGSALPHLFNALVGFDWRVPVAVASASAHGGDPVWLAALCIVWGISIVADSAQFSASIAELADRSRVGTMLTVQTALGFTLTLVTIQAMPYFVAAVGWRYAFIPLAVGPALGVWAMARLRAHPRSLQLAGGRR